MHVKVKCKTVGAGGAGKTCLHIRYIHDQFPTEIIPTVFEDYTVNMDYKEANVDLGLFDTDMGEDYHRLRPLGYPGTDFFLICFAVDDRNAFLNVEQEWYPEVVHYCPKALVFLVGTKVDLRTQKAEGGKKSSTVSYEEGSDLTKKLGLAGYMECSALTGEGVCDVFNQAIDELMNHRMHNKKKLKCLIS